MTKESVKAALDNADRVLAGEKQMLVKVQYGSATTGEFSSREYTYYSMDRLAVGDILSVPVGDRIAHARVSAIDVPESEIEAFKDKVKTIPAGSVLGKIDGEDVVVSQVEIWGQSRVIGDPPEPGVFELSTEISLRTGEDIEAHRYYEQSVKLLEYAEARVIATAEDNKMANDDLTIISRMKKAMEAKKREYLDPLREKAEAVRETYSTLMDPIIAAEKLTKSKMLAYNAELERIRKAQEEINRKRIEAAQEEAVLNNGEISESVNLVEVLPEPAKKVSTDMGTSGQVAVWKYEIIDVDALPREYMMPDLVMLNAIAKKYHDQKKIAGVRFYNEPIIANRAR